MKKAYHTTLTTEYAGKTLQLEIGVWDDGEAEIEEAYSITETKHGKVFQDETEWLKECHHRVTRTLPEIDGVKRIKHEYPTIEQFLLDYHADEIRIDRAGALTDRARDEWKERMAAE